MVLDLSGGNGWNNPIPFRETGVILTNNNKKQHVQVIFGTCLRETFRQEN